MYKIYKIQIDLPRKERTQINKIINERGNITINVKEIIRIFRDYYEQVYVPKMDNLEIHKLPGLNDEEIKNPNRYNSKKIESESKTSNKEKPRTRKLHCKILSNI